MEIGKKTSSNRKNVIASIETYIGVDIGKTKVAVGLVSQHGDVLDKSQLKTDMVRGGNAIIEQCRKQIYQLLKKTEFKPKGIGIGSSGVVDPTSGIIVSSGAIPNWSNIHIKELFENEFKIPVALDNDVHAAAMGEYFYGAGQKSKILVFLVISTGVGICTIYRGNILRGVHNLAGQIAYIKMFKNGKTVNDVFSGNGISENGRILYGRNVSTEEVFTLADNGELGAQEIIGNAIDGAATIIALIQNIIDPDIIIVGGSVAVKQSAFIKNIGLRAEHYLTRYRSHIPNGINIVSAKLGEDAGLVGSAALCLEKKLKI